MCACMAGPAGGASPDGTFQGEKGPRGAACRAAGERRGRPRGAGGGSAGSGELWPVSVWPLPQRAAGHVSSTGTGVHTAADTARGAAGGGASTQTMTPRGPGDQTMT